MFSLIIHYSDDCWEYDEKIGSMWVMLVRYGTFWYKRIFCRLCHQYKKIHTSIMYLMNVCIMLKNDITYNSNYAILWKMLVTSSSSSKRSSSLFTSSCCSSVS